MRFATSLIALVLSAGLAVPAMAKDFVVGQATLAHGPKVVAVPKMLARGPRKYTLSLPTLTQFSDGSILTAAQLNALLNVAIGAVPASQVGIANGVAALDGNARVLSAQMPLAIALGSGSTAVTQTAGDNTTAVASDAFLQAALLNLSASNLTSGTVAAARLPLATTSIAGAVRPDGSTVTISNGVISAVGGGGGTGNVAGPASSTANHVATFGDATGKLLTDGGALGTAATKAASGSTGIVASLSGAVTSGHCVSFSDSSGTIRDSGVTGCGTGGTSVLDSTNQLVALQYLPTSPTNVLSLACGITINDGNVHTVGQQSGSGNCFDGKTTLAGLANITINGQQPFSFLTASTLPSAYCTYNSTANCFTSSSSFNLTDAKAANLDIAWLAIEGALWLTRDAYLPGMPLGNNSSASYVVGSQMALPVMIPLSLMPNGTLMANVLQGDDPNRSIISTPTSFGYASDGVTVLPMVTAGDPWATPNANASTAGGCFTLNNSMSYTWIKGLGFDGVQGSTNAWGSTFLTDGLRECARTRLDDVAMNYFTHDWDITGDHLLNRRISVNQGIYGWYWMPNYTQLVGDLQFEDVGVSGQARSPVLIDGNSTMEGRFLGELYLNGAGYQFEGMANGNNPMISDSFFDNLMLENTGLGVAIDDHVFSGGTYNDANKTRAISDINVSKIFVQWNNSTLSTATTGGLYRRATWDVAEVSGRIGDITNNGGQMWPLHDTAGHYGIAVFNVNGIGTPADGLGFDLDGDILGLAASAEGQGAGGATIPIFNSGVNQGAGYMNVRWHQPGTADGTFTIFQPLGNVTRTYDHDLLEYQAGSFGLSEPANGSNNQPAVGVAMQNGLTSGQVVPIETRGDQQIATGYHYGNDGFEKKDSGPGGRAIIVGGSGGTNGTYAETSTGGGCSQQASFNVVVAGGQVTQINANFSPSPGAGPLNCTSPPTIPVSGISGLTGASVTLQWPAAGVTAASSPQDGVVVGFGMHYSTGSTGSGTQTSFSRLIGMQ